MTPFFLLNTVLVFLGTTLGLWLGFWVYLANRKDRVNQTFLLMTIFVVLWVNFAYFCNSLNLGGFAQLWAKLGYGMASLFFIPFYFFSISFPRGEKKSLILNSLVLGVCLFLFLFSISTDLLVKDVEFTEWGNLPLLGKGTVVYFVAIFLLTLFIVSHLFKKYLEVTKREKQKVQYLLVGLFIFIIANIIFNVILPFWQGIPQYYQFGNYSVILLLAFTAFAIVKEELFGIKVVITTIFVVLTAISLALDAIVFTDILVLQLFKGLVLAIFVYLGYLLIRSVMVEIKQRQEIEKLSRAKSEFISIASHQLRTPLTAIKGYISMILEGVYGGLPVKTKRPMKNVYDSNERLIRLVNDLLSLSRIESGKMQMSWAKTSVEDLISSVIGIFGIEAKKKGIFLKFEKPKKSLPKVLMDPDKMREVISNIVSNAIKYTEKGGITIKAKIAPSTGKKFLMKGKRLSKLSAKSGTKEQKSLMIEVSDTGAGMTEDEISKVFESFSRGVAGTRLFTGGAGLGLYISRQFIGMHHGKVWVESPGRGKGSTFHIELPIK